MCQYKEFFENYQNSFFYYLNTNQIISNWRIDNYIKIINGINSFIYNLKFQKIMIKRDTSEDNNFLPNELKIMIKRHLDTSEDNKSKIIDKYKKLYKNITKFKILLHIHLLDFYNTYSDSDVKYKSVKDYTFYCSYFKKKYKKKYTKYNNFFYFYNCPKYNFYMLEEY